MVALTGFEPDRSLFTLLQQVASYWFHYTARNR
jgi:hypothetical protein